MMGWEKQNQEEAEVNNSNQGIPYVKVMTDEQLETLRKQISVYATICEQLVEMHKNLTSHPDLPGMRLGSLYCDPMMTSAGHKITARQRWTPTPVQLQMLERIFEQGNGTPSKQKIKDMTAELGQHGQISETNVYNWFQNRRARSKRKQHNPDPAGDPDSPTDRKARPQDFLLSEINAPSSPPHFFDRDPNFPQMPFYDNNPRSEHMSGKMEVGGGAYGIYDHEEDYSLS